jgi:hypothetical protein
MMQHYIKESKAKHLATKSDHWNDKDNFSLEANGSVAFQFFLDCCLLICSNDAPLIDLIIN